MNLNGDGDSVTYSKHQFKQGAASGADGYDPFVRGRCPVGVRTIEARDAVRDRLFPCEIWYPAAAHQAGRDLAPDTWDSFAVPRSDVLRSETAVRDAAAQPGTYPLIMFSHPSGTHRRTATFLCTHLSSHGYVVAALDHSEVVTAELASRDRETDEQKAERVEAVIASRVPDTRFLLDHLLTSAALDPETHVEPTRIGIVGHSSGAGRRLPHRRWTRASGPWWHSRRPEVPGRSQGFFR